MFRSSPRAPAMPTPATAKNVNAGRARRSRCASSLACSTAQPRARVHQQARLLACARCRERARLGRRCVAVRCRARGAPGRAGGLRDPRAPAAQGRARASGPHGVQRSVSQWGRQLQFAGHQLRHAGCNCAHVAVRVQRPLVHHASAKGVQRVQSNAHDPAWRIRDAWDDCRARILSHRSDDTHWVLAQHEQAQHRTCAAGAHSMPRLVPSRAVSATPT